MEEDPFTHVQNNPVHSVTINSVPLAVTDTGPLTEWVADCDSCDYYASGTFEEPA